MDPGSSSYAFTFDGKDAFAELVEAEYLRRGGERFRQVVALGDGAAWFWGMAEALYPHATHIADVCHAREVYGIAGAAGPGEWLVAARPRYRIRRRRHAADRRDRPSRASPGYAVLRCAPVTASASLGSVISQAAAA
jgi:hypothetical protein